MPTHSDVVRLNLEFYKKQAKSLLKAVLTGDAAAVARLRQHHTKKMSAELPKLADAQFAIAREQGFPNWPRFKSFIEESRFNFQAQVAAFIAAATSNFKRAEELLAQHPQIEQAGFYVALVLGDVQQIERAIVDSPNLAKAKSGPENHEPLLYTCFSRYANPARSPRAAALTEIVRILLRNGADPNTRLVPENPQDSPLSCLYASSGLNSNPEMTQLLLDAGANPNDGESLYHSIEHGDLVCMRLLLARGAKPDEANALKHMLDREDLVGLRILIDAGSDPNYVNERAETALHWAAFRGRSAKIIETLVDAGAHIDAKRSDGRTAYAIAALGGHTEAAKALAARGADTTLAPVDAFVAACSIALPEELDRLLAKHPEFIRSAGSERLLPDLATAHRTASVRALLSAGFPVDARGGWGGTALHWCCWKGHADLVKLLLDYGASLAIQDETFHGTPADWFTHGLENGDEPGGNYVEVARLLAAAKAQFPKAGVPTGNAEVDAVLQSYGII
jgi:ankyrin repeat protein